jgi:hypothetical protein
MNRLIFPPGTVCLVNENTARKRVHLGSGFWVCLALGLLLNCEKSSAFPRPPVLNASTDLEQLPGVYKKGNMLPNVPGLDSAPLLNDAIKWVSHYNTDNPTNPYTQITVQAGVYYFLSTTAVGGRQAYVVVSRENPNDQLQNVTIDLGGSFLFFANALYEAFDVSNCNNLVLSNFSVDYQILPFTQLHVLEILGSNRILAIPERSFQSQAPYVDVYQLEQTQFNKNIPIALYGFDFQRGHLVTSTGRWTILPLTEASDILTLEQGDAISIKPGDTFEVEARGGGPAIWVQSCNAVEMQALSIYSSGGVGIITNYSPGVSIDEVKVIPRPRTNRLVSTNAGGIAVNQTGEANRIQNCTISGTQDDCISGNSPAVGYLAAPILPPQSTCVLAQPNSQLVSVGSQVYFVDPLTGAPIINLVSGQTAIFTIASLQPSGTKQDPTLIVTMQSPLPVLPAQAMMYSTDPATRGAGLVIDSNDISSNTLARGIALSGQTGVTISNNTLSQIQEAGILCGTDYSGNPKKPGIYSTFGPLSNIVILHNHLHRTNIGITPIGITMLAGIQILTINSEGGPASAKADEDISIIDNEIDETPRTGIWVMNIQSGEISNNLIRNFGYDPVIPKGSHLNSGFDVTVTDFQKPLVVQSSTVTIDSN